MRSLYDCNLLHSVNTGELNLQDEIMFDLRQEIANLKIQILQLREKVSMLYHTNTNLYETHAESTAEMVYELHSFKRLSEERLEIIKKLNFENTTLKHKDETNSKKIKELVEANDKMEYKLHNLEEKYFDFQSKNGVV